MVFCRRRHGDRAEGALKPCRGGRSAGAHELAQRLHLAGPWTQRSWSSSATRSRRCTRRRCAARPSHAVPDRIALDGTLSLDWPAAEVLIDGLAEELCFAGPLLERMARARATIDGLRQGLGAGRSFAEAYSRATVNASAGFFLDALLRAIVVTGSRSDSSGFARLAGVAAGGLGSRSVGLRDGRIIPLLDDTNGLDVLFENC
jgi:hypothetical protein